MKKKYHYEYELVCSCCDNKYTASSYKYARHNKGLNTFCSENCRWIFQGIKKRDEVEKKCPQCASKFLTKDKNKIFCCMDCYLSSDSFKDTIKKGLESANSDLNRAKNAASHKKGELVKCAICENEFYKKKSTPRNLCCSRSCYIEFLAKRFDRYVKGSLDKVLIGCYDEFLNQDEIKCPFDDCNWSGDGLLNHINFTHGVKAHDFKKATGFSFSTGVISKTLRKKLEERNSNGVHDFNKIRQPPKEKIVSKEAKERMKKSNAIMRVVTKNTVKRICKQCGIEFYQDCIFGKKIYCSTKCRSKFYRESKK